MWSAICHPASATVTEKVVNSFKTEAESMDWFLYDNGLHLERVKQRKLVKISSDHFMNKKAMKSSWSSF